MSAFHFAPRGGCLIRIFDQFPIFFFVNVSFSGYMTGIVTVRSKMIGLHDRHCYNRPKMIGLQNSSPLPIQIQDHYRL